MPYLIPRTASVTLDASGAGAVAFNVDNTNQRWIIDTVAVQTSQAANTAPVPQAIAYRNSIDRQGFAGGTMTGNLDTAQGRMILYPDDTLYVAWTGGIPGTIATATVSGTFDPAGVPLPD